MPPELLIAILAGLGGMLGWGFADFFAKKTIDRVGSIVSLVWAHLFGTLILGFVAIYNSVILKNQITIPTDFLSWGLLLFFGVLQAIVYLLAYEGFGKGQLAVMNPIFASFSGLTAVISIVFFKEVINPYIALALMAIFGGILLMNIDTRALLSKRFKIIGAPGLKEILLATVLAALWTVFWDKTVSGKDWLSYALFMYAFMTLAVVVIARLWKINLSVIAPPLWKFLILIGLCETIAYVAISLGYSTTSNTSIVALLSGAFSLPTIILARAFLKEKVTAIQTVGSLVIIVGIVILSIF